MCELFVCWQLILKGPWSPYEMNFYSMTNVGRLRLVIVDDVLQTASSMAGRGLLSEMYSL